MIKKDHPVDAFFSEELKNLEIAPPEGVWDAINNKLEQKRRIGLFWFRLGWAAGIALIISVSATLYLQNHKYTTSAPLTQIKVKKSPSKQHQDPNLDKRASSQLNVANVSVVKPIINHFKTNKKSNGYTVIKNIETTDNSGIAATKPSNPLFIKDSLNYLTPHIGYLPSKDAIAAASVSMHNQMNHNLDVKPIFGPDKIVAQEPTNVKRQRWSLEGEFAPSYAFRTTSSNVSQYNNDESGLIAWSSGLRLNYSLSHRLSFQFGIYYSVMGQVINSVYRTSSLNSAYSKVYTSKNNVYIENSLGPISNSEESEYPQADPISNSVSSYYTNIRTTEKITNKPNSITSYSNVEKVDGKIIQKLNYLEIPLIARYRFIDHKFKWHILGGINVGLLLNSNAILKTPETKEIIGHTTNIKPFNYNAIAGFGFLVPVRRNIQFLFEPTFKYNINSLSDNYIKGTHLYSFNFYTGFSFNL
jgi:hypothetical protein